MATDLKHMEKEQYHSVIQFLFSERKLLSEIKERLDVVYGKSSLSMATVEKFRCGRTSVPGAPKMATTRVT